MNRRFPWRVFLRLFLIQTGLILLALAASGIAARHFFKVQFISELESQLRSTLTGISHYLPESPNPNWCGSTAQGMQIRLTWIAADGAVLCDSRHDTESMDNHSNRPEVIDALKSGFGQGIRFSHTLNVEMLYGAIDISGRNQVLRGAIPLSTLNETLRVIDRSLAVFLAAVAVLLLLTAIWTGRTLVNPLSGLMDKVQQILKHSAVTPTPEAVAQTAYGEWSELEEHLNQIQNELETKLEMLTLEREQQATIMSSISDAILAVDGEGQVLFFNSKLARICGRLQLQERKHYWELFRTPEVLDSFANAIKHAKYTTTGPIPIEQEEGVRFYSVAVSPLRKGIEVYGAVGVFHDVTELKRAEQMRIDFVANVSHELRTPLTAIKGFTDTVVKDVDGGKPVDPEFLNIITRNANRLMALIEDLLDLSALESTEAIHKESVSTDDLTKRVLNQLQGLFEAKRHEVKISVQAHSVLADVRRLEQVLVNLLDNAAKFTPMGGRIEIFWREQEGEVLLEVRDNGPGIPFEHQARLFERFYRIDKARSRDLGGSGLGLAIVKHIMQRHGGSVGVKSALGQGAVFICRFPKI